MKKENVGYIQLFFGGIIVSFLPILVRLGKDLGNYNLTFFRVFFAAFFLGIFFLYFRKKFVPFKYERKKLIFFGIIHGFILLGYFTAINFLSIASAVLLLYTFPIWMVIFSYFILREKLTKKIIFALIISFIGIVILLSPTNFFIKESLIGSVGGLIAGMGAGLVYVLSKTFKKYDKVSLIFWQNLIAIPVILPLLFINFPSLVARDWIIVLLIGFISIFPFVLAFKGLSKINANRAGVFMSLEAIFPIILALLIFNEIPNSMIIFGGVLIIMGAYLATTGKS